MLDKAQITETELKALVLGERDSFELTLLTELLGLNDRITCNQGFELVGLNLEAEGKLTEGSKAKFTGCYQQVAGEQPCEEHSEGQPAGTIVTNELKIELVLHTLESGETEVLAKVEPKAAKGTLATTDTEEGCPAFHGISVKGTIYLKDGLGQATTYAVKHLLELSSLTTLFVGSKIPASADGTVLVELGGFHLGLKWAAMDV